MNPKEGQSSPALLTESDYFAPQEGKDGRIALVAGSFDPITVGHEQLIRQAAARFSHVYVTVFINPDKHCRFSLEDRFSFLRAACAGYENAEADVYTGYLADYAAEKGITVVVKGYRNEDDLANEIWQAEENHRRNPALQTLLLPCEPAYAGISSTLVRAKLVAGESVEALLPDGCRDLVVQAYERGKN